jgi:hypothetical protein
MRVSPIPEMMDTDTRFPSFFFSLTFLCDRSRKKKRKEKKEQATKGSAQWKEFSAFRDRVYRVNN